MKQILFFLLFAMQSLAVFSQEQKIFLDSFQHDPFDTAAKSYPKKDNNGDLYALVKVRPYVQGLKLKFGIMRVVDGGEHEGEHWFYVQKNARKVTISRNGYTTIHDTDLGNTLEAGQTYVMLLSYTAPVVKKQILQFVVQPEGIDATVMIRPMHETNFEFFGRTGSTSDVSKNLAYGNYAYQVMADKYITAEGTVTLDNDRETKIERVTLAPNFAVTTLSVDADADIYIDNELKGRRTWSGTLVAGLYNVETRMDKHRSSFDRIEVKRGEAQTFQLTPPVPITGAISVITSPAGATIEIDGQNCGVTPRNVPDVLIGRHTLTVSLPDYKVETTTIDVEEGKMAEFNTVLSQMATMEIHSTPSDADLFIDGKAVGQTPYTAEMASGDYMLRISKHKYCTFERSVHLDVSHPKHEFTLKRQYHYPTSFYVQPVLQVGTAMSVGGGIGAYLRGFNVELFYLSGMVKSETVYWNYTGAGTTQRPVEDTYKLKMVAGGKVGYGFICNPRLRVTPQLGVSAISIDGAETGKGNALAASLGVRGEYAFAPCIGFYLAPELDFALSQSEFFKQVADVSSKVKGMATGFNCRLGIYLFF